MVFSIARVVCKTNRAKPGEEVIAELGFEHEDEPGELKGTTTTNKHVAGRTEMQVEADKERIAKEALKTLREDDATSDKEYQ